MLMSQSMFTSTRFEGDRDRLTNLMDHPSLGHMLRDARAAAQGNSARRSLLANAVRVDVRYLPDLAASFDRIHTAAHLDAPFEAYVHADPCVNASVIQGKTHLMVVLSSGAVNDLSAEELEFIIGHELGHAVHGHLDVAIHHVLQSGQAGPQEAMDLLAWSRAAEISADRAGLVCCNSIDIAANALFKTLSGLGRIPMKVDPVEFAEQWDHLADEVIADGENDSWHHTHPFPPLRMKAMNMFWECWQGKGEPADLEETTVARVDDGIARLLGMMDPGYRQSSGGSDPFLEKFIIWGGLYVAAVSEGIDEVEINKIASLVSPDELRDAMLNPNLSPEMCLEEFKNVLAQRRKKLAALELHRLLGALVGVALSDGVIDPKEKTALGNIAELIGVPAAGVTLLIDEMAGQGA